MSHPTQTAFMEDWRNRIPKEILQQDAEYYKLQDRWNAEKEAQTKLDVAKNSAISFALADVAWAAILTQLQESGWQDSTIADLMNDFTLTRKNQ